MTNEKSGAGRPEWDHWAKLSEVKVYEALALLENEEPPESCPDPDDESPAYRKRMRRLLDALPDREWFTPKTLDMGNALLCGVNLPEVGRWAKANGITLPAGFPVAGPRIAWEFWKARKSVALWEACMLSVGIDPDNAQHSENGWMAGTTDPVLKDATFPSPAVWEQYRRRLVLLTEHRDDTAHFTPLTPAEHAGPGGARLPVRLVEFAVWAKATGLTPMPAELEELAATPTPQKFGIKPNPARLAELNASMPRGPVKWDVWLSMPRLPLWMAVALSLGLNPGAPSQNPHSAYIRDRQRVGRVFGSEFIERLDVAQANVSTEGPLVPLELRVGVLQDPAAMVSMQGFIEFTQSLRTPWTIPQELAALLAEADAAPKQETKEEREDRRLRMCDDAGLKMDRKALLRMPDGIGALAKKEDISRQAFTDDVKAALTRRLEAEKEGGKR
jgi:hypothetical protein